MKQSVENIVANYLKSIWAYDIRIIWEYVGESLYSPSSIYWNLWDRWMWLGYIKKIYCWWNIANALIQEIKSFINRETK